MYGILERLAAQAAGLGASPSAEQLEGLRGASAAVLAAARAQGTLGAAQQKQLFEAACGVWVSGAGGGRAAAGGSAMSRASAAHHIPCYPYRMPALRWTAAPALLRAKRR